MAPESRFPHPGRPAVGVRRGDRPPRVLHARLRNASGRYFACVSGADHGSNRRPMNTSGDAITVQEFHYRLPALAHSRHPGHHRGKVFGSGLEFSRYAPLLSAPDPRRLDVRATLADPFGTWQVRVFQQRASIPVILIADLSASMSFHAPHSKVALVAQFAECLAHSVYRTGDA